MKTVRSFQTGRFKKADLSRSRFVLFLFFLGAARNDAAVKRNKVKLLVEAIAVLVNPCGTDTSPDVFGFTIRLVAFYVINVMGGLVGHFNSLSLVSRRDCLVQIGKRAARILQTVFWIARGSPKAGEKLIAKCGKPVNCILKAKGLNKERAGISCPRPVE